MPRWHDWRKQLVVRLVRDTITPEVRQGQERPRTRLSPAPSASLSLEKRGAALRRLVLKHGADFGIVEADFERGCRHHDACIRINAGVLRTRSTDAYPSTWCEHMSKVLNEGPALPDVKALGRIGQSR